MEDSILLNPSLPRVDGHAASGASFQWVTFLQLKFNVEFLKSSPCFSGFVVIFRRKLGWKDAVRELSLFIDFILDIARSFFR